MTRAQIIWATRQAMEMHSKYEVDTTGLGWTAKREFLIYDAGTIFCQNSGSGRTPHTKVNDGWAICAIVTNANDDEHGGDFTWPYLISTEFDNVVAHAPVQASFWDAYTEYDYLGLHWYCCCIISYNLMLGGATDVISDHPVFDWEGEPGGVINGTPMTEETFERIMERAGVKVFTGGTLPVLSTAPGVGT